MSGSQPLWPVPRALSHTWRHLLSITGPARSQVPKSRCEQVCTPSEALRENLSPSFPQHLEEAKCTPCFMAPSCSFYYEKSESVSHSVMSDSLQLPCPWSFPDKNTRVSSHSLLQRVFLTQGSNPGLQHCRQILFRLYLFIDLIALGLGYSMQDL